MKKLAILTGGSKGLGAALCNTYLARGYELVEFSRSGSAPYSVQIDLSDPHAAGRVFSEHFTRLATSHYDEIVAVNNAATLVPMGAASKQNTDELIVNMNVNIVSPVLFISRLITAFQEHACRKSIVNISSGASHKPYAGWSLYCASKAGIEHFVRAIAAEQEKAAHPFRLVNIAPGVVDTEIQDCIRASNEEDFPSIQRFIDLKNSGSLRSPQEAATIIASIVDDVFANGSRIDAGEYSAIRNA